jgi:hypothetical protein
MILCNGRLVPELTRSAEASSVATSLRRSRVRLPHNCPQSGPTQAKPSGEHTPLGGFVFFERAQMAKYRVVTIDKSGLRHRGFVCDNDDDAIVWAKQLVDEAPVELWNGARFVTRLEPRSSTKS